MQTQTEHHDDSWMDSLEVEAGVVLRIDTEEWLDWVFGEPESGTPNLELHSRPAPVGALDLWREELKAKARTFGQSDPLTTAACQELSGLDALRDKNPWAAAAWFGAAEKTIVVAAEKAAERKARRGKAA